ncbi:MAG: hypothetical protein WCU88_03920 [Elusimicrobiota bacterium]|jgi:tetratricopeptide (TPR) repeat protein
MPLIWVFLVLLLAAPTVDAAGGDDSRGDPFLDEEQIPAPNTSQAEEELKKADPRRDHLATFNGEQEKKPSGKPSDEKSAADVPEKPQVWPPQLSEAIQRKLDFSSKGENQAELKSKGIDPKTMGHRAAIAQMVEDQNPAGLKLMVDAAMRRFPDDPVFRDLHKLIEPHFAAGHFDHIAKRTIEESRKLFGVQLIPSDTAEGDAGEVAIRAGKKRTARATTATSAQDVVDRSLDLIGKNNPALADKLLTREILRNRLDPNLYSARALARYDDGNLQGADEDSLMVIKLCPDNPQVYANRAFLMRMVGRWPEAKAWAERALQEDPTNALARITRGQYFWREGQADLARKEYKLAAASDPDYRPVYEKSMNESPSVLNERRLKAMNLLETENYAAVLRETERLLVIDPRDFWAHDIRALAFVRLEQCDSAIREANLSLAISPNDAHAFATRSKAYAAKGRGKEALADIEQAARLNPKYQKYYKDMLAYQSSLRGKAENTLAALKDSWR